MTDVKSTDSTYKPTKDTYDGFQQAYDVFNRSLFGGELPNCLITLQRRKRSYGYFSGNRFHRSDGQVTDEIALNPAHFRTRPVREILATFAHEMVHLWQHHFGHAGRGRYHNRQWAEKMKEIGLHPTDTGEEGGKETGEKVHHLVVSDGRFEKTVKRLLDRGFTITWTEKPRIQQKTGENGPGEDQDKAGEKKSGKRVKYVCGDDACDQKAWAKHEASLVCGLHMVQMHPSS